MGVCRELLIRGYVLHFPAKQTRQAKVDDANEDGRIQEVLPGRCRTEDTSAAKREEDDVGRRLNEGVDKAIREASGGHGRSQSNEERYFRVERWVDGECCKGLRCTLAEPDVG